MLRKRKYQGVSISNHNKNFKFIFDSDESESEKNERIQKKTLPIHHTLIKRMSLYIYIIIIRNKPLESYSPWKKSSYKKILFL